MIRDRILTRIGWPMKIEHEGKENLLVRFLPLWIGIGINILVTAVLMWTSVKIMGYQLTQQSKEITVLQESVKDINERSVNQYAEQFTSTQQKYYAEYVDRELRDIRASIPPEWVRRDLVELKERVTTLERKK